MPLMDGLDDDTAPHEVADNVDHVLVVSAQPIDPAYHKGVAGS
jgi:hypothetical protein